MASEHNGTIYLRATLVESVSRGSKVIVALPYKDAASAPAEPKVEL